MWAFGVGSMLGDGEEGVIWGKLPVGLKWAGIMIATFTQPMKSWTDPVYQFRTLFGGDWLLGLLWHAQIWFSNVCILCKPKLTFSLLLEDFLSERTPWMMTRILLILLYFSCDLALPHFSKFCDQNFKLQLLTHFLMDFLKNWTAHCTIYNLDAWYIINANIDLF